MPLLACMPGKQATEACRLPGGDSCLHLLHGQGTSYFIMCSLPASCPDKHTAIDVL